MAESNTRNHAPATGTFDCPHCGRVLNVDPSNPDGLEVCPYCRKILPVPARSVRQAAPVPAGHVYYLACLGCSSRLEVRDELAGQRATCPTCGVAFVVPDLVTLVQSRGQTLRVGTPPEERMAVHAYAAAGQMAPEILTDPAGSPVIRCRRCGTINQIEAESCRWCGVPFTIEAGTAGLASQWDGWTVASVVLGATSVLVYVSPLLAVAAIATGLVAVKRLYVQYNGLQCVAAWSGVALGGLALAIFAIQHLM